MADRIYLCSTYYHVLIALLKALSQEECCAIAVTHYIPEYAALAERIRHSGIFSEVYAIGPIAEYQAKNRLAKLLFQHTKNRKRVQAQLPLDLLRFSNISVFHDDTWMAHYLQDCKKPYCLLEDGLDAFRHIRESSFAYMVEEGGLKRVLRGILHYGYQYCGMSPYTTEVEVNSAQGLELPRKARKKVVVRPRKKWMEQLSREDVRRLNEIFQFPGPRDLNLSGKKNFLLLTQPFYADGVLPDMNAQIRLYQSIVEQHCADCRGIVYVKPHPRDSAEYAALLRGDKVVVMDRNMPVEMLKLNGLETNFQRVISVNSTAVDALDGIAERVVLGWDYLQGCK